MSVFPKNQQVRSVGKKIYIDNMEIMLAKPMVSKGNKVKLTKKTCDTYGINQPPVGWWASEKLDGIRAIWDGERFVSRGSPNGAAKVYSYVPDWFENLIPKGVSFDGEIWIGRNKFQEACRMSTIMPGGKYSKEEIDEMWKTVKFMIFDVPSHSGLFEERMKYLNDNVKICENVKVVEHQLINTEQELNVMYDNLTKNGAEGVMLRAPKSPYVTKRSNLMLKMKIIDDAEAIVVDYIDGTGKYDKVINNHHMLGSLTVELVENGKLTGITFGVGTGFNDEQRINYWDPKSSYYIPIGSLISFSYMEKSADGVPRHPAYRGLRQDQKLPNKELPPHDELNDYIIDQFQEIIKGLKVSSDSNKGFKIAQYTKIIKSIKNIQQPLITTQIALEELRKQGHKFASENYGKNKGWKSSILIKIDTILQGGSICQVDQVKKDPMVQAVEELTKIPHIGTVKAKKLYENNIKTVDELRQKVLEDREILTDQQQIGLKYFPDIKERIPRKEMKLWDKMTSRVSKRLSKKFTNLEIQLAGSFRRNKPTSGDVDILITADDHTQFFKEFVAELIKDRIIVDIFSRGDNQIMAVAKLKLKETQIHRHIDIFSYSKDIYPFALLHATGSDEHNKTMRTKAIEMGLSLSQYGLKNNGNILDLNIKCEKDIFSYLKMDYVEPENR